MVNEYTGNSHSEGTYAHLGNYNQGRCASAPYPAGLNQPVLKVIPSFGAPSALTAQQKACTNNTGADYYSLGCAYPSGNNNCTSFTSHACNY